MTAAQGNRENEISDFPIVLSFSGAGVLFLRAT